MTKPQDIPNSPPPIRTINARSLLAKFFRDLIYMPRWHKGVLGVAAATLVLGWLHLGYRTMATTQPSEPSALGSWARRVGTAVLIGFLVGWIFRTFLKIMASITALVLGAIVLLSYFNVSNVDLTAAKTTYKDTSSWVTDQAGRLRTAAMSHVHSTLGTALGLFIGARKKTPRL